MALTDANTLLTIIYSLLGWATISTVLLLLARRDVKLGLTKWWMQKRKMQPVKIRYHGPDKNIVEMIVSAKDQGETLEIRKVKFLFFKAKDGMRFILDSKALRRGDDGIQELSYNYKSIMPQDLEDTEAEVVQENNLYLQRQQAQKQDVQGGELLRAIDTDGLVRYTDPKRLNKFVDYVYLAAKADALEATTDIVKWVKWGVFASVGALLAGVLVYYTLDGKVMPILTKLPGLIQSAGSTVLKT